MTPRERAEEVADDLVTGAGNGNSEVDQEWHFTADRIEFAITEAVTEERERCAAIASHSGMPEIAVAIRKKAPEK
jgi:hypothetical protein